MASLVEIATRHRRREFQDAAGLERELRSRIEGEVRFDDGSRALYATDGSNYRQVPIGVVVPKSKDDVVKTVGLCREFGAPLLARGGGTSLAGQCCNVAVVIDLSKYLHNILELDPEKRSAVVQPGTVLDDLRDAAEKHHLTFAPDPSTHNHCTLGGMIGNNSCGVHSVMAGKTVENTEELEVLLYDGLRMKVGKTSEFELRQIIREGGRRGEIYQKLLDLRDRYATQIRERYPKIPRRVSGYNLDQLLPENGFHVARALVGSECTLVTVLEAKLRLVHSPPSRSLLVLGYPDVYEAGDHVPEILGHHPIGLEGLDDHLISFMKKKKKHVEDLELLPSGKGWLLVEFGGDNKDESDQRARDLMDALKKSHNPPSMKLYDDKKQEKHIWEVRESGLGATAFVPGDPWTWEGWEDSAVAPEKMGDYLRQFRKLLTDFGYLCALYGHFGDGCLHTRIDFDLITKKGIRHYRSFVEHAADLVVSFGGSLSGEHGDGQSRAELLPKMFGPELIRAFEEYKSIWDPDWKMNPGKVVRPYRVDQNLRLGADYKPWRPKTHFQFPDDHGDFSHAALRCVGVGECRKEKDGTMCPSYMVTREEKDSTRGRTHLLFEMMQGKVIKDRWQSEAVKESLDLCLACKGCKGECPINVDMATYKAEFLSHYFEKHPRPLTHYAFGYVDRWAHLASGLPEVANLLSQTPGISGFLKQMAGISQHRRIPAFAPYTFKSSFFARSRRQENGLPVILWADTFNNYFHPQTAEAAVEVLEAAGRSVRVPRERLCCGRPLFDFGLLASAKTYLRRVMKALQPEIEAGIPVVVLEPSCAAVFRDELRELFPNDPLADRLRKQTFILSEFLEHFAEGFSPPKIRAKALVHGHCHHKAVLKFDPEESLLKKTGLDFEILPSGCCGMAGSFGFEKDKYDVSVAAGERVLLPAVRAAAGSTFIIADGFSCREQIAQLTDRRALHMAEVLQMALHQEQHGISYPPEKEIRENRAVAVRTERVKTAGIVAGVALAGAAAWMLANRSRPREKEMRDV